MRLITETLQPVADFALLPPVGGREGNRVTADGTMKPGPVTEAVEAVITSSVVEVNTKIENKTEIEVMEGIENRQEKASVTTGRTGKAEAGKAEAVAGAGTAEGYEVGLQVEIISPGCLPKDSLLHQLAKMAKDSMVGGWVGQSWDLRTCQEL